MCQDLGIHPNPPTVWLLACILAVQRPGRGSGSSAHDKSEQGIDRRFERAGIALHLGE